MIGAGSGAAAVEAPPLPDGMSYYTVEEVGKHTTKADCWVILDGKVLNVTNFLSQHPGGELAILTFAGKDATEEFNMIHPPDVIPKYAPDAIIGVVGDGSNAAPMSAAAPAGRQDKGGKTANHHAWGRTAGTKGNWREEAADDSPGVLLINVEAYLAAGWYLLLAVLWETCATIFTTQNF